MSFVRCGKRYVCKSRLNELPKREGEKTMEKCEMFCYQCFGNEFEAHFGVIIVGKVEPVVDSSSSVVAENKYIVSHSIRILCKSLLIDILFRRFRELRGLHRVINACPPLLHMLPIWR